MGYTVEYAWVKLAGDFFSFELGLSVCWLIRPRRVNQTLQKVCHDFCPTLPLKWKDGTIDPFIEQARMKENTHSLNNNQNYDIYSFIHEERWDERLRLLVTKSDTSVGSSPWLRIKGQLSSQGEWYSATNLLHRETWSTHLHREETDAVRVRVLRVVTPKTSWQRRILSRNWGREHALSESSLGARDGEKPAEI